MIQELDIVVLTTSVPAERLVAGDAGTVVHVYAEGQAYEVEFMALDGHTVAVATLLPAQIRPATRRDMRQTREMQSE